MRSSFLSTPWCSAFSTSKGSLSTEAAPAAEAFLASPSFSSSTETTLKDCEYPILHTPLGLRKVSSESVAAASSR